MLVPASKERLASPAFCQANALSTVHQQRCSQDKLDRLSLLCITSAQADMLSPFTLAAASRALFLWAEHICLCRCDVQQGAAAKLQQVPPQQLVCPEQMG